MSDAADTKRNGRLFVFEGIDGSGKTTQLRRAAEALRARGLPVLELVEPTRGPYGQQIRALSRPGARRADPEGELELFLRDRRENVEQNIAPALARGDVILLDRYYFSTMAYQGARGLDPEDIRRRNEAFAPRPDLVLYFELPVAAALRRIQTQRAAPTDLFERHDDLARVKELYDDMARRFDFFVTLDAAADPDTVARAVLDAIDRRRAGARK